MTISIHLDKQTERDLRQYLQAEKLSLSEFVRDAIKEKMTDYAEKPSMVYELGKDLFGAHASGRDDLSTNRKALLKEKLHTKHRH